MSNIQKRVRSIFENTQKTAEKRNTRNTIKLFDISYGCIESEHVLALRSQSLSACARCAMCDIFQHLTETNYKSINEQSCIKLLPKRFSFSLLFSFSFFFQLIRDKYLENVSIGVFNWMKTPGVQCMAQRMILNG